MQLNGAEISQLDGGSIHSRIFFTHNFLLGHKISPSPVHLNVDNSNLTSSPYFSFPNKRMKIYIPFIVGTNSTLYEPSSLSTTSTSLKGIISP